MSKTEGQGHTPGRSFFVIERFENGKSAGYWDGGSSRSFVDDINEAVQFCRRQDPRWIIHGWHWKDVKVTEHVMLGGDTQPAPAMLEALEAIKARLDKNWRDDTAAYALTWDDAHELVPHIRSAISQARNGGAA